MALEDSKDEFVHLYEIRDALKTYFGNEQQARSELDITKAEWQRLGVLANTESIQQSRRRGLHTDPLRQATKDELDEARRIASGLIEKYVRYLDG